MRSITAPARHLGYPPFVGHVLRTSTCLLAFFVLVACSNDRSQTPSGGVVDHVASAPTDQCGDVRLTSYQASTGGWCEFDRTAPMLPASVRAGLTLAIAEPWNGSSYAGASGEACGECWEITSLDATQIVMVHDLCPVEGNPVCNGSMFHFDVSTETAAALNLKGLDAASTRRVPCPVMGNAHLQLLDRNQWGYVRFQVLNHRVPVRSIEYCTADAGTCYAAKRSGGAWAVGDHAEMFASDGSGGLFRLTSARGEVVAMPNLLTYEVAKGTFFDLGGQFSEPPAASAQACEFLPPSDVYVNGYGGIENVRWTMNPWSSASPTESTSGCVAGSCLRIAGMGSGAGFHVYYRQSFDPARFSELRFSARSDSGSGSVNVTLTGDGTECRATKVALTASWAETRVALSETCSGVASVNSVTVYGDSSVTLWLDDLAFVR